MPAVLPVLLPLLLLIGSGLQGLDFGTHWDEKYYQIRPVKTMVSTGILLPRYYGYPSFNYWVGLAALTPEFLASGGDLLDTLDGHRYLLRLRAVFLIVTSLSVLWIYLLVLNWRRSWPEALLAALFLAFSWEVAYHLRWVATDGMLMQFGALTILLATLSRLSNGGRRWLYFAAAAAGFGCGTKYPGGLLLVPVLIAGYSLRDGKPCRGAALIWVRAALIFAGAYLLTTPATLFDSAEFAKGVAYEIKHYAGGHAGHTISPGPQHLWRMLVYFSSVLFSHYAPIACSFFLLAALGTYSTIREDYKTAILFLSFPVLYIAYFSTQRAMVVRNLLVAAPFLAVLAARGAAFLWGFLQAGDGAKPPARLTFRCARAVFAACLIAALTVNAAWLFYAAGTITDRGSDRYVREAAAYILSEPDRRIFVSPRVRAHLSALGAPNYPNVTDDAARSDKVLFYAHEGVRRWQDWQANAFWLTETWFGPYEVNFNAYPNWWGDDRIVVMPTERARRLGILVVE
jgi:4-amino-4-deoxy-L-arabinose transferase-like glycosyltransferase